MKVVMLSSTAEAKRVAFSAIRSCYSAVGAEELFRDEFEKYESKVLEDGSLDSDRLIRHIVGHKHVSTLEHVTFTFAVEGVSRALLGQLTRHRVGWSYSVQSQRYVKQSSKSKHGPAGFVMPNGLSDEAVEVVNGAVEACQDAYNKLVKMGVKAEDARSVLPMNSECKLVVSCNVRAFMDFWGKRGPGTHAQDEIRELAIKMKDLIVAKEPWLKFALEGDGNDGENGEK